jgi:L-ascorbate metabolism protein UlaG (beta-lactamase superfamily)
MAIYWSGSDGLSMMQTGLTLVCGVWFAIQGELSIGNVWTFVSYISMLIWPIRQLGRILSDLGKSAVSLKRLYERDNPLFIVPLGLRSLLNYHTSATPRCEEKDWWDTVQISPRVRVSLTPALHWSRRYRHPEGSNRSLWCGFSILCQKGPHIFFAGDTAASGCFDDIYRRLGSPTVAILPIGAYRPDWIRTHHTNPEDAVHIMQQLHAQQAIACHFGTWQLADDGYRENLDDLATALHAAGIPAERFIAPDNGQTVRGSC